MERAREILGPALKRIRQPEAAMAWLAGTWAGLVGESLAAHAKPIACRNGSLLIETDTAEWKDQAVYMKTELAGRINLAWGGTLIRNVRFQLATRGRRGLSREADEHHTPFLRNGKKRLPANSCTRDESKPK